MKLTKKIIAVFLSILTLLSICSVSTTVFAAEYTEQKARTEYFDSALSGYLKNIVDTEDAVSISEKEQIDEIVEEVNSSVVRTVSTFSLRATPAQSTETAKEIAEDLDINHTRLTLELEDGENVAYLFSEPVSFIDDEGNLVYKDTNIKAVTDGIILNRGYSFENGNNDYKAYFSEDSSKGLLLVEKDGEEIRLVPNGTQSVGTVKQIESDMELVDSFEYAGVYGTDSVLRFLPQLNGCKEEIVLSSYQGISDFSFTLYTEEGTIAAINSNGEVEIIDSATKDIITTFVAPFANDSSGGMDVTSEHYTDCTYELEMISEGKYTLTISVPEEYLESESTVYPVIIDPTTGNVMVTNDSAVYSAKSTTGHGGNPTACFGKTSTSQYGKGRAMFFFRVPEDIENYATISSAKLWLRETTGRTETMYVRPYLNSEAWASTVTWDTQPAHRSTFSYPGKEDLTLARRNINSKSTDNADNPYWYAFNITNAVRAWTTGTANKGLKFIAECEASDGDYLWRAFATKEHTTSSYRPYAVISYTNDTTVPKIESITESTSDWTNGNVKLTVKASDTSTYGVKSYYFSNEGAWETNKASTITKNGDYTVKVQDYAGNKVSKTHTVDNIDKTAPVVKTPTKNPSSEWSNTNVTVTNNATDALSGIASSKGYYFDNDTSWQDGKTKTYSAEGTYTVTPKAKDKATNIGTGTAITVKIDKTAPVINSIVKDPSTEWSNTDVKVTINASDALSGIATSNGYSFNNGTNWQTNNYKTYSAEGIHTVTAVVKDKATNPSAKKTATVKIDKTAPTATVAGTINGDTVDVTVTASDTLSGLHSTAYSFNGGSWVAGKTATLSANATHTIKVRDKAGNIRTVTYNPKVGTVTASPSLDTWTNGTVTLTASGTNISQYNFDSGAWGTVKSKSYSANTTAKVGFKDNLGNITYINVPITNIDITEPVINSVTAPEGEWTNQPITVTVNAKDDLSGISQYSFDGGVTWQEEATVTYTDNAPESVNIVVKDKAGNETYFDEIKKLPKPDPGIPTSPDLYEQDGLVYISSRSFDFNEETDSPEHIEYKIENGEWTEYDGEPINIVRTYSATVYARVRDDAENISPIAEILLENTLGEYTASYTDIALGEGLFPVEFGRTYTSTNGWFFTFDANIDEIDENAYVFTDFYGEKQYFIKNSEGKYLSVDEEELTVNADSYVLTYGDMICTFGILDGKINRITTDYLDTAYTWNDNGTLTITGGATVTFTDGEPTEITITRTDSEGEEQTKVVKYEWSDDGNLTKFFDAAYSPNDTESDSIHNYAYTNGLLTTNDTETISYSNGRVKLISQPNGAFVKYTYNDSAENAEAPNNIGAVTVSDSKGVTDTIYYADGVYISNTLDSYGDNATYAPESIADKLVEDTTDSVADVFYVVTEDTSGENNETSETTAESTADEEADETAAEEETTDDEGESTEETTITDEDETTDTEDSLHTENIEYNSYGNIVLKEEMFYESETDTEPDAYKEEYLYDVWNQCVETISTSNSKVSVEKTEYDILGRTIKLTQNDKVTDYLYDNKGNLINETTNNEVTRYEYSNSGNLLLKTLPNNTTVSYGYDLFGNMISKTYLGYKYVYNTLGSILDVSVVTSEDSNIVKILSYNYSEDISQNLINADYGNEQSIKYYYNEKDEITSIKINDEEQYNYVYFENVDESGETVTSIAISDNINDWTKIIEDDVTTIYDSNEVILYSVEDNISTDENDVRTNYHKEVISGHVYEINSYDNADVFISNGETLFSKYYQFDEDDNIIAATVDNVVSSYYGYNDELVHTYNNQFNNMDQMYIYTYDDSENIVTQILTEKTSGELGETIESSETINYAYDNKKQLISAETSSIKYEYTYDDRGNILTKKEYSISIDENSQKVYTLIENNVDAYIYDETWKDKLISYNDQSIIYDEIGNPINYLGHNLTWSFGRQLTSYDDIVYCYNEDGIRTIKQNDEIITKYYLDEDNIIEQDDGVNRLHFLYDSCNEISGFVYNENVYHYVKNIQNDIISILNGTGEVVVEYEYDPWGMVTSVIGDTVIGKLNPFRYRSYYYDADANLYYLQTRYYDPETGRFINCDDFSYIESQTEGLSWNAFAYCENNPVNSEDPTGCGLSVIKNMKPLIKIINSLYQLIYIKVDNLALKDSNKKVIDKNRTNSTKGFIKIDFTKKTNLWEQGFEYGRSFSDSIAELALEKFQKNKNFKRPFLFSDKCVGKEIHLHLQGYLWSIDKKGVSCPVIFSGYWIYLKTMKKTKKSKKKYIKDACCSADMYEADVIFNEYEGTYGFGYFKGISNYYFETKSDPYYNLDTKKRDKDYIREGWINEKLSPKKL